MTRFSRRMPRFGLVVVLALVAWSESEAGLNRWTKAGQGGYVWPLAASAVTPGLLWGTDIDESLVRSTDGGATWKCVDVGEDAYWSGVYSLIADPTDDETLYLAWDGGCCDEGVVKSSDGGRTWVDLRIYPPDSNSLAINLQNHDILYAINSWYVTDLWKSIDGGRAWRRLTEFPAGCDPDAVTVDAILPSHVYVATECGVYRSTDTGQTWATVNNGLPGDDGRASDVRLLRAHPQKSDELWATTDRGIYHTTNGGAEWLPLKAGLGSLDIGDLIVTRSDPPVLYAVTGSGQVYRRRYGGTLWLPRPIQGAPASCSVHLQADAKSGDTLYATVDGTGVLRTTDGGQSWSLVGKHLSLGWVNQVVASPKHGGTAYMRDGSMLYKTIDAGSTWQMASGGLPDDYWEELLVHSRFSRTTYVLGWDYVGRSADGGKHWTASRSPFGYDLESAAIDPANLRRVVASVEDRGLYESLDGGSSWQWGLVIHQPSHSFTWGVTADPAVPGTVWAHEAESARRLWRSIDWGESWSIILGNHRVSCMLVSPFASDMLYVADMDRGVCKSTDGGATWRPINSGLTGSGSRKLHALAASKAAPNTIYAATDAGIFRLEDSR